MKQITGFVLAGGKSIRIGQDKGLIQLNGKQFVEHALSIANQVCKETFIIANSSKYKKFGAPVFADIYKEKGPAGGICTGLIHSKTNFNLVLGCDLPFVSVELLKHLVNQVDKEHEAFVPVFQHLPQPLCAVYSKNSMIEFDKAIQEKKLKMQGILKGLKTKYITIDESLGFYSPDLFFNVNTKEDLEQIIPKKLEFP
ncbi:MAG: hypothetical protein COA57_10470 [Flavobacteriales bacterium]|nr:MAG: hypothetical protein COA57_10470 [Flavobacteriales bacterium]